MTVYTFYAALKSIGRSQKTGLTSLTLVTDLIDQAVMKQIIFGKKSFRLTVRLADGKHDIHDLDEEKVLQR